MEDGIFDVRRNYPVEFLSFVRRRHPIIEPKADDFILLQIIESDVREFAADLTPIVSILAEYCRAEIVAALDQVADGLFLLRYVGLARTRILDAGAQHVAQHALTYALFGATDAIDQAWRRIGVLPDVDKRTAICRAESVVLLKECKSQVVSLGHHLRIKVRPVERDPIESLLRVR